MVNIYERLEKRLEAQQKATEIAWEMGYIVEDFRYLTNNPDDEYLFVALCHKSTAFEPYVVWLYNSTREGFTNGQYSSTYDNARQNFENR